MRRWRVAALRCVATLLAATWLSSAIPARAENPDEGDETGTTPTGAVMRGRAVFITGLGSVTIRLLAVDAQGREETLQTATLDRMYHGVFELPLRQSVLRALRSGADLRVLLEGLPTSSASVRAAETVGRVPRRPRASTSARLRLAAELHAFDPTRDVVHVDLYSSLVSLYRRSHPGMTLAVARAMVGATLGAPATTVSLCAPSFSTAYLSPAKFLAAAGVVPGASIALERLDGLAQDFVHAVDAGKRLSLGTGGPRLGDVVADAAGDLAVSLLKSAASKVAGEAVGWAIDSVLAGPDATAEQLAQIQQQLSAISQQLTHISEQLDALSAQLAEVESHIINEIDLQAYQARASSLQKEINVLCGLENQLILLTQSDPTEDHTAFVATLAANIQTSADPILRDLQTELLGSPGVEGLISLWGRLNATGTGYPVLFANLYLRPATINLQYYEAAQVLALNLLSELGHYEGGTLGQNVVNSAMRLYFPGIDQETIALAAAKRLPDGSYPAALLASDDVTVDSRSGLMWQRVNFCTDPYFPPDQGEPPSFDVFPPPDGSWECYWGTWTPGYPHAQDALAAFTLSGLAGWRLPTAGEMTNLYQDRGSKQPWDYLHAQAIILPTDGRDGITSSWYWVSDACPNGIRCVVDLRSGGVGNSAVDGYISYPQWDSNYAIGVRSPLISETYHPTCDATGKSCAIPCGPPEDPASQICNLP